MEKWAELVLSWFRRNRRRFLWREYRDWYRVLVAEVMLVRTRSETAEKVYRRFLDRFRNPEDLCGSSEEEVAEFFRQLGLVNRAKRLREAVCTVLTRYGGTIPCSFRELVSLPGVGRYIARVILTRVCGSPSPFIDANVLRFAGRFLGLEDVGVDYVEKWLERSVSREDLEDLNTALIDLAGLVCTPRNPKCGTCPVSALCSSRLSSTQP